MQQLPPVLRARRRRVYRRGLAYRHADDDHGPKSEPYGISAIHDVIWYSESGTTPNTVVRFDPKTETFQSWALPGGGNIVRNTSVTRDGDFVLANSLVNSVTLVKISK